MPQSPAHRLAAHVHAAALEDDLVFLDARADVYLCAPGAAGGLRLHPGTDAVAIRHPGLARDLEEAGLVICGSAPAPRREAPPPPVRSALTDTYGPPSLRDLRQAPRPLLSLLRRYRGRPFLEIVDTVPARSDAARAPPSQALLAAVARFHRWVPFAPVSGKCLLRSFLLLQVLRREGFEAQWVFGVATWPFRAHCWLQAGEVALDDHVDRLAAYTPILVV